MDIRFRQSARCFRPNIIRASTRHRPFETTGATLVANRSEQSNYAAMWPRFHRRTTSLLFIVLLVPCLGCPGTPKRNWQTYPHLTNDPTFRKWLIVKCTVQNDAKIPTNLDQTIGFFFTVAGVATGNLIDYYSDVSYGALSL